MTAYVKCYPAVVYDAHPFITLQAFITLQEIVLFWYLLFTTG